MILSKQVFIKQLLEVILHFPSSLVFGVFWFIFKRSWHCLAQSKISFCFDSVFRSVFSL